MTREYNSENRKLIMMQYSVVALIVLSYIITQRIGLFAAVIAFIYILITDKEENAIALLLFILPFSNVFKISVGTTSLYIFLRVACVIRLLMKRKIPTMFIAGMTCLIVYSMISSLIAGTSATIRILNLVLWFFVGLAIIEFVCLDNIGVIARSLSQGVIISCIIAMCSGFIPNLQHIIKISSLRDVKTNTVVSRFSGLWDDPNGLTVFICAALFICFFAFDFRLMSTIDFFIYAAVLSVAGLYTVSKSCMLILVVFWTYVFFCKSQQNLYKRIILMGVFIAGILALYRFVPTLFSSVIYRFSSATSVSDLTTHRLDYWSIYLNNMDLRVWIVGKGINCQLPGGFAAHNTLLQLVYNIGIAGTCIWFFIFVFLFFYSKSKHGDNKSRIIPILTLASTMLFLDGLFIELFYLLLSILIATSYNAKNI